MLFSEIKRGLKKDLSSLPAIRVGVVGDAATQFLVKALRAAGGEAGVRPEIYEAEFDQIDRELMARESEIYGWNPQFILIYTSTERLWMKFTRAPEDERDEFAGNILSQIEQWWGYVAQHSSAKVIQTNFCETVDPVFGHFASKVKSSFRYQVKKLNFGLMTLAQKNKHAFVADIDGLSGFYGYDRSHDPRLFVTAKLGFALDFLPSVAKCALDIMRASEGRLMKCLVLDLDNTLWGGVIGDDGVENIQVGDLGMGPAYSKFQAWAKELKNRGVILAVCSKNDEEVAKRPFLEHPDMILRLDDIAVFMANWEDKASNIRRIQEILNIGLDSIVFADDNPFERNLVRELLPAVLVPELPEDPALYVSFLSSLNLFETATFSEEDGLRTRQYKDEAARVEAKRSFSNVQEYLQSLKMVSSVRPVDAFLIPRVAQLTQRSNQFNLRTVRYSEAEVEKMGSDEKCIPICLSLRDKFGDHGLIAVIILKILDSDRAFVDTWIMSCRVLKRGMEEFTVNQMARLAAQRGMKVLIGEYLPTAKNGMVKSLYPSMGFTAKDGKWEMPLLGFQGLPTFIEADLQPSQSGGKNVELTL